MLDVPRGGLVDGESAVTFSRADIAARADLSEIAPVLREMAVDCLVKRDSSGFLVKSEHGNTRHLSIVFANWQLLRSLGIFEEALLDALTSTRTNNRHEQEEIRLLLGCADRKKLRAAGEPLPGRGPHTIYRGVAGRGRARHLRGLSWTLSPGVTGFFAERFANLGTPAVFRTVIPDRDVLAYVNEGDKGRHEQEVFVQLPPTAPLEIVPENVWRLEAKKFFADQAARQERQMAEAKEAGRRYWAAMTPKQRAAEKAKRRRDEARQHALTRKVNEKIATDPKIRAEIAAYAKRHTDPGKVLGFEIRLSQKVYAELAEDERRREAEALPVPAKNPAEKPKRNRRTR